MLEVQKNGHNKGASLLYVYRKTTTFNEVFSNLYVTTCYMTLVSVSQTATSNEVFLNVNVPTYHYTKMRLYLEHNPNQTLCRNPLEMIHDTENILQEK